MMAKQLMFNGIYRRDFAVGGLIVKIKYHTGKTLQF